MYRFRKVKCEKCGSDAIPLRIDIIPGTDKSSELVDLLMWLDCPPCGKASQQVPHDLPTSHDSPLKRILDGVERKVSEDEARLLMAMDDDERAKLVEELADLQLRLQMVKDWLTK